MSRDAARSELADRVRGSREQLVDITSQLVRTASENPPGDTQAVAAVAARLLSVANVDVEVVASAPPIVNVIARIRGATPGRRLVYNGHLDTYPIGDASQWSVDPLGALVKDGRLYGRGAADMKGGIACSILAARLLAQMREAWAGEVVLTLAGDEESMGPHGTQFLLEQFPHAAGDAMITGDAGSPDVVRFGEKGMIWLDVTARGKAAHGAHAHLGLNAIERLMSALVEVFALRDLPVPLPAEVDRAIDAASAVSEAISGTGESETLRRVTVNCGIFQGGILRNITPATASATLDIRLPAGIAAAQIEARLADILGHRAGIEYRIVRRFEPLWSDPNHGIVACLTRAGQEARGRRPVVNYRVGGSDARLYRMRNVPSYVCGLTPFNMGGADEYVDLDELCAVAYMHTLAGFDYLDRVAR
ncbi:MAG: M20/M25/M40 family metallo-hydrolase [Burkholderiales bacterium]|nr:M20/M25/M40 family metallo-hydrolase [Burkholderiales bacterium]